MLGEHHARVGPDEPRGEILRVPRDDGNKERSATGMITQDVAVAEPADRVRRSAQESTEHLRHADLTQAVLDHGPPSGRQHRGEVREDERNRILPPVQVALRVKDL
jgi:hypothetical protein